MIIVLMGVSGCGKTTVGRLLAEHLLLPFHDADDFHAPTAVKKMRSGLPLDDIDRLPWLQTLAANISDWNKSGGGLLACSALKADYRHILTNEGREPATFFCLKADKELLQTRLAKRTGHFFHPGLLQSQLESLEITGDVITVNAQMSPEEICMRLIEMLEPLMRLNL